MFETYSSSTPKKSCKKFCLLWKGTLAELLNAKSNFKIIK